MKTTKSILLAIALMASGASLQAAFITNQIFANTSFEGGSSANWSLSGTQDTYSDAIGLATDFGITAAPGGGDYVLKLTGDGGFAYQGGTATIAADTSYTLSYDIWLSSSNPTWSGQSTAFFYLGNDQYGGPTSRFYSSGVGGIADPAADYLASGQWWSVSRTVDAAYIATNPSLYGQTIGVAFSINPQSSGGITYYVDNVQMNAVTTAVPEPSTYALVLGGIATLLLIRRRVQS
jgi:hypothetical protein